jgi:hypothetical protein
LTFRAWVVVLGCAACATAQAPGPRPVEYPTVLTPPDSHPGAFIRRQLLLGRFQGQELSLDAVLQKKDDELLLVGLTPFGTKAFVLAQKGTEVRFTSYMAQPLPFPPRYILEDVTRTYFCGIADGPLPDGVHQSERDGELIEERWKEGRLMERRFTRLDGNPRGEIVIDYVGGMAGGRSPARIEFDNGWLGYRLTVTTVSEEAL